MRISGMIWVHVIIHLEWFTDSNDALQSTAVVAKDTLCSPYRDFFLTDIHLEIRGTFSPSVCFSSTFIPMYTSYYLNNFFIEGHFSVFDPCVGDVVRHTGEPNLNSTHTVQNVIIKYHIDTASHKWLLLSLP